MIELLGITVTYELLVGLGVTLLIDEVLPFLPTKANGIVHAIVLGVKRSKLARKSSPQADKIDEVLDKLNELKEMQENAEKIDRVVRSVRGK
jgi:hypothetical protein